MEKVRLALARDTPAKPPLVSLGEPAIYGTVDGDQLELRLDRGVGQLEGNLRVKLFEHPEGTRAYATVTEDGIPILAWLFILAYPFVILGFAWPILAPSLDLGRRGNLAAAGVLWLIAVGVVFRWRLTPSRDLLSASEGFLTRVLLGRVVEPSHHLTEGGDPLDGMEPRGPGAQASGAQRRLRR
jgi:hypothetical protein